MNRRRNNKIIKNKARNIMGIHKLMSLILEKAAKAVKQIQLDSLTGRTIACDASTVALCMTPK